MIGRTISHYRILSELGRGGMGVVYLAEDLILGRQVAIKFVSSRLDLDRDARQRFLREARAAASLEHPGICTVFDTGECEGQPFMVMALLEGQTLSERFKAGPLPVAEALAVAVQVAEALETAHGKGIVHRDIKPGNVMILTSGRAVVMDFGLARAAQDTKLTRTGALMGTVAYMAPEQVRGRQADHRVDIWALGAILYEGLTGSTTLPGRIRGRGSARDPARATAPGGGDSSGRTGLAVGCRAARPFPRPRRSSTELPRAAG